MTGHLSLVSGRWPWLLVTEIRLEEIGEEVAANHLLFFRYQ
jgi:hypothetical protein